MERHSIIEGDDFEYKIVACVDEHGQRPAEDALDAMVRGEWGEDPEVAGTDLPNDEQIRAVNRLIAGMTFYAEHGYTAGLGPGRTVSINKLRYGLWEFKEGNKRIAYFDTQGDGVCNPKSWQRELGYFENDPGSKDDVAPLLDFELRLSHAFGKPPLQRKTPEQDMQTARKLMEEDLAHDRTA